MAAKTYNLPLGAEAVKRRVKKTFKENRWFWLFWVSHVGFAFFMYYGLRHKSFRIGSRSLGTGFLPLYQADVSALISATVSITKFFFQTWCGIAWWRMIYILLGSPHGIRLPDLTRIAAGTPSPLPWKSKQNRGWRSFFFFFFICLIFVVQNFASPFLLASISWNPVMELGTTAVPLEFLAASRESDMWSRYNAFTTERGEIGPSSAAASFRAPALSSGGTEVAMWRNFAASQNISLNSTVNDLLFPFISVKNFDWVYDPEEELTPELISAVKDDSSGYLNISGPGNPLTHPAVGNAALLRNTTWAAAPIKTAKEAPEFDEYKFPMPVSVNEKRYLAVLVSRTEKIDDSTPCPTESADFGPLPNIKQLSIMYTMKDKAFALQCYAVAKFTLRAGSYRPPMSTVVLQGVAEAIITADQIFLDRDFADPLASAVLDAMPEVMSQMSIMNAARAPRWNNLEAYARGMVMQAYQATWNTMTEKFQTEALIAEAYHPQYMIAILIEGRWFLVWVFMVFSGVLLSLVFICVANHHEEAAGVLDPALAALRLDPSGVYKDVASLCSSADLSNDDKEVRIRFAKKGSGGHSQDPDSSSGGGYEPNSGEKVHYGHIETGVCQFGILEAVSGDEEDVNGRRNGLLG